MGKGFFKENAQLIESVLQLLDLLFILCAFLLAAYIRWGSLELTSERLLVVVSTMLCVHMVFSVSGLYRRWRGNSITAELVALATNFFAILLVLGLFFFFSKTGEVHSRIWILLAFFFSFLFTGGARVIIRSIAKLKRRNGFNTRTVLIVGGGELGVRVARSLAENSWTGIRVIGFVDDDLQVGDKPFVNSRVLGNVADTQAIVEEYRHKGTPIDYVWVALPAAANAH